MYKPRHFTYDEFNSPDVAGSGRFMNEEFIKLLDLAREIAGVPFVISSGGGYRTQEYNDQLQLRNKKASPTSSHLKGLAADIVCKSSQRRHEIISALLDVGITRIGISKSFIHCDIDSDKPQELIWVY